MPSPQRSRTAAAAPSSSRQRLDAAPAAALPPQGTRGAPAAPQALPPPPIAAAADAAGSQQSRSAGELAAASPSQRRRQGGGEARGSSKVTNPQKEKTVVHAVRGTSPHAEPYHRDSGIEATQLANASVAELWPYVSKFLEGELRKTLAPALKKALPEVMGLQLRRVALGSAAPVANRLTLQRLSGGGLRLDASINWKAAVDVRVDTAVATAGLSGVAVNGVVTAILATGEAPPFLSYVHIYFANLPSVDLEFTGLAQLAHLPGLSGAVAASVESALAREVVLPNRVVLSIYPGAHPALRPAPVGVLRLTLLGVENVPTVEWGSIDTLRLARVRIGCSAAWSTATGAVPVGRDTSSPYMWAAPPPCEDFEVADLEQRIHIEVCDGGWTVLATAAEAPAGSLVRAARDERTLQLPLDPQGSLHLHVDWLSESSDVRPRRLAVPRPVVQQAAEACGNGCAPRRAAFSPSLQSSPRNNSGVISSPMCGASGAATPLGTPAAATPVSNASHRSLSSIRLGGNSPTTPDEAPALVHLTLEVTQVVQLQSGSPPYTVRFTCGRHSRSSAPGRARWEADSQEPAIAHRDQYMGCAAARLLQAGVDEHTVAQAFGVSVAAARSAAKDGMLFHRGLRRAVALQQCTFTPLFDESVHLRMQYDDFLVQREICVQVLDTDGIRVAALVLPLPQGDRAAPDFTYEGPFTFALVAAPAPPHELVRRNSDPAGTAMRRAAAQEAAAAEGAADGAPPPQLIGRVVCRSLWAVPKRQRRL